MAKIESKEIYNDGKYILLYCLEPSKEQLKIADEISKKLQLPMLYYDITIKMICLTILSKNMMQDRKISWHI